MLKYLSGLAILNLLAVSIISNFSTPNKATMLLATQTPLPTPTPIVVVKKVITKVYRTAKPVPGQNIANQVTAPATTNNTTTNIANTAPPAPVVAPPPQVAGCVVVIDGASYDVTNFRFSHSGGDIFSCGSDMSASFWNRHNASILAKMQKYRI